VPPEQEEAVKEFVRLVKARNESASEKVLEWIIQFVEENKPVNPQTRLDVILDRGAPAKEPPTCSFCLKPATYIGYLKDGLFSVARAVYLCDVHRNVQRAQSPYYGERKL